LLLRGTSFWPGISLTVLFALSALTLSPLSQARADESVGTIDIPGFPYGVDVNQKTGMVYATNFMMEGGIFVIDGATDQMVSSITTGDLPTGLSVDANTDLVYVADYGSSDVAVVNGSTDQMVADVYNIGYPGDVVVNPDTDRVYVGGLVDSTITVINGSTNTVASVIQESCGPVYRLAVNPATDTIYATTSFNGSGGNPLGCVLVINGQTDTVAKEILLGYSKHPAAIAVDTRTNTVYVGDGVNPLIYVINGSTNALVGNLTLGDQYIAGIAINPTTDTLFVSHTYSDTISVVDAANDTALGPIPAQGADGAVAVNVATGAVYVADFRGGMLYVIGGAESEPNPAC
jgi:DNA-binding beta-propeller fold protein YncE